MKKLTCLALCLMLIFIGALTGCAGFSINRVRFYNEVLAKVGEQNITRFDLLTAYNSYGANYYMNQLNQGEKEALNSTLDLLIDRESLYQYALDNKNEITDYQIKDYQMNDIIKDIYSSLDDQMAKYLEKAKVVLNIETKSNDIDTTEEETKLRENYKYKKRATLNADGSIEYIVPKVEPFEPIIDESYLLDYTKDGIIELIRTTYFDKYFDSLKDKCFSENDAVKLFNKIKNFFSNDLINYEYYLRENNKPFNKVQNDLFDRYFKRTLDSEIKSQYLTNVQNYYLSKPENLSVDKLKLYFDETIASQHFEYATSSDISSYKAKMKNISTNGDSVLYHPEEIDTQYGYFLHTLISFTDEQKNKLAKYEKGSDDYNRTLTEVFRELDLANIILEYNTNVLKSNNQQWSYEDKLDAFIDFMFKYTGDKATLDPAMPYVVGSYDSSKGETFSTNSSMVEAFTNEAIKLMKNKIDGTMSTPNINDTSSLCITEYGIHFVFYVGDVNKFDFNYDEKTKAYIELADPNVDPDENYNLYYKKINPIIDKTFFDCLFDAVYPASSDSVYSSNTGYADEEERLINLSKQDHKVVKYTTKINSTSTNLK